MLAQEWKEDCHSKTYASNSSYNQSHANGKWTPWVQMNFFCGGTKAAVFRNVKKQPTRYGSPITTYTHIHTWSSNWDCGSMCVGVNSLSLGNSLGKKSFFSIRLFPHLRDVFEEGERTSRTKHMPWHFSTSISAITHESPHTPHAPLPTPTPIPIVYTTTVRELFESVSKKDRSVMIILCTAN